jgi:DNA-binding CsgD family transcriptional regulator
MKYEKWINGLILGITLILIHILDYRAFVRDISLEVYGLLIALIFIGVGIWVGRQLIVPKNAVTFTAKDNDLLSKREMEVLKGMAEGLSNQQIADKLFISLNTIKTHSQKIFSKLQAERRVQAIQKARDLGILE